MKNKNDQKKIIKKIVICFLLFVIAMISPHLFYFFSYVQLSSVIALAFFIGITCGPIIGALCGTGAFFISTFIHKNNGVMSFETFGNEGSYFKWLIFLFICGFLIGILCKENKNKKTFLKLLITLHVAYLVSFFIDFFLVKTNTNILSYLLWGYINTIPYFIVSTMITSLLLLDFKKMVNNN